MASFSLTDCLRLNTPRSKNDVCALAIHVALCKEGFVATEVNEVDSIKVEDSQISLPSGWNQEQAYVIFYKKDDRKYVMKALPLDDDLCCQMMEYTSSSSASTNMSVWTLVPALYTDSAAPLTSSVQDSKALMADIVENLASKFLARAAASRKDPAQKGRTRPYPDLGTGQPGGPLASGSSGRVVGGVSVGSADLTPGGFGSGGMIFDPRRSQPPSGIGGIPATGGMGGMGGVGFIPGGGLPAGAVPPGARFDPFGPPIHPLGPGGSGGGVGGFGPNPDHMPMPGFEPGDGFRPQRGRGPGGFGPGRGGPGFGGGGFY